MFIIYEFDEPVECPHCTGDGEIRLDLHDSGDVGQSRHRVIMCGHCEGYGYIEPEYIVDADFSLQPPEPDNT